MSHRADAGGRTATATERVVLSGGAALSVVERGEPDRPTIVLTHGWPDSSRVWDLVVEWLAPRFHVVTFDTRGCGASTPALVHRPYELAKLAADIGAVIDAVSPDRPVHLVGHDWGSVEGWEYLRRPEAANRLLSFTSLSGPNLDVTGWALHHPTRASLAPLAAQAAKSAYTVVLSIPVLPGLMWRLGLAPAFRRWLRISEGIRDYPGPEVVGDAVAAVALYRTNIWPKLRRPDPRPAPVPVHLIVATRDNYVSPRLLADTARWAPDLTRHDLPAGHWSPRSHPEQLAALIADYVETRTR
jgi:pimeloyl-ACP methyl ester carboxylesterase